MIGLRKVSRYGFCKDNTYPACLQLKTRRMQAHSPRTVPAYTMAIARCIKMNLITCQITLADFWEFLGSLSMTEEIVFPFTSVVTVVLIFSPSDSMKS